MFLSTITRIVVSRRSLVYIAVQGKAISMAGMMKALSDFVGADMSDVDRYVLKQGSTMVSKTNTYYMLYAVGTAIAHIHAVCQSVQSESALLIAS